MRCRTFFSDVYRRVKLRGLAKSEPELVDFLVHKLGVLPGELGYYVVACAHRSSPFVMPSGKELTNERLEFLGDAVLELVVSDHIFRRFPFRPEGDLTRLRSLVVSRSSFNDISEKLGLAELVRRRRPECKFSQRMLGDILEAFFGAMFLDRGFQCVRYAFESKVLTKLVQFDDLLENLVDAKTKLLEWSQQTRTPVDYETLPDPQNPLRFVCRIFVQSKQYATGIATTKKQAEQLACQEAIDQLCGRAGKG